MADDDFSTGAELEISVSDSSLSEARDTIESELGDLEVDVNAVVEGNNRGVGASGSNSEMRKLAQSRTEDIHDILKILRNMDDNLGGGGGDGLRIPRPGGGGGGGLIGGAATIIGVGAITAMGALSTSLDDFTVPNIPPLKVPDIPPIPVEEPGTVPVEEPDPIPIPEPNWLPINIPEPGWLPLDSPDTTPTGDTTTTPTPDQTPTRTPTTPFGRGAITDTPDPVADPTIPTDTPTPTGGGGLVDQITGAGRIAASPAIAAGEAISNGPLYQGPDPLNAREHPGRAALAGGVIAGGALLTQADSPLPGPADVLGAGVISAGAALAGTEAAAAESTDGGGQNQTVRVDNSTDVTVEQTRDDQEIIDDVMEEVDREMEDLRRELERSIN